MAEPRAFTSFETLVQQAYVAYYGRPADPDGLAFWRGQIEQAGSLDGIIQAFGESPEFTQRFADLTPSELVTNLFQQLFNRDPDPAGLDFYTGQLASGAASLQSIAVGILSGAQGADADILANKVSAANTWTTLLEGAGDMAPSLDADAQSALIRDVGADGERLDAAQARMDGYVLDGAGGTVTGVFTVTTTADGADGETAQDVTLREAIVAANQRPGLDKIVLPEGVHELTLQGPDGENPAYTDLVINDDLIIEGAGADATTIDSGDLFRAMHIGPKDPGVDVKLSDLTLQGGRGDFGGGVNNEGGLLLDDARLSGNAANSGGGVFNSGELVFVGTRIDGNSATSVNSDTGFGGAVWNNEAGRLFAADSSFDGNSAAFNGGGVYSIGQVTLVRSDMTGNTGVGVGGAVDTLGALTVDGGTFSGNTANDGGAIAVQAGGTAEIAEATFTQNRADGLDLGGGGALFNFQGTLTVTGSLFEANTALGEGGGAIETNGPMTLRDSRLIANRAETHDESQFTEPSDSGLGGAVLIIAGSTVELADLQVRDNVAGKSGGGLYNDQNTSVTATGLTVRDNQALADFGGGIKNEGGLEVTGSTIAGNNAGQHAGGVENAAGTLTLIDSTVADNTAPDGGGLGNFREGTLVLLRSEVTGNTATGEQGGGVLNNVGRVELTDSTVSGNASGAYGGGVSNNPAGTLVLDAARIADNTVGNQINPAGSLVADGDAIRNFGAVEALDGVEVVGVVINSGTLAGSLGADAQVFDG